MAWAVGLLQTQAFTVKANNLQLLLCIGFILAAARAHGTGFPEECGVFPADELGVSYEPYSKVTEPTLSPNHLQDLPGFTRSFYKRDHALITPESQVFGPLQSWLRTTAAFLISPATGSHFSMYLAKMEENSTSGTPGVGIERFIFVVKGDLVLSTGFEGSQKLSVDSFVYVPPNFKHSLHCDSSATIVVFERRYQKLTDEAPKLIVGSTYNQPVLETPGEVFILRKLLPTSAEYDFNVHVMDFQPGEYLNVKTWKHF